MADIPITLPKLSNDLVVPMFEAPYTYPTNWNLNIGNALFFYRSAEGPQFGQMSWNALKELPATMAGCILYPFRLQTITANPTAALGANLGVFPLLWNGKLFTDIRRQEIDFYPTADKISLIVTAAVSNFNVPPGISLDFYNFGGFAIWNTTYSTFRSLGTFSTDLPSNAQGLRPYPASPTYPGFVTAWSTNFAAYRYNDMNPAVSEQSDDNNNNIIQLPANYSFYDGGQFLFSRGSNNITRGILSLPWNGRTTWNYILGNLAVGTVSYAISLNQVADNTVLANCDMSCIQNAPRGWLFKQNTAYQGKPYTLLYVLKDLTGYYKITLEGQTILARSMLQNALIDFKLDENNILYAISQSPAFYGVVLNSQSIFLNFNPGAFKPENPYDLPCFDPCQPVNYDLSEVQAWLRNP